MRFTAEQCSQLKFPVGCPVWFNLGDVGVKEASTSQHPKRGVVSGAEWNNKIFYEVTHADKSSSIIITEEVEDDKLGFGATCPITILPDNVDADTDPLEGECVVSPSTTNPNTFVYTAMIFLDGKSKVRYESGIEEKRVVYRKVDESESIVDNSSSVAFGPVCKGKGAITDDTSEAASSPKEYDNSSLMRTNNGSYDDEEGSSSFDYVQ